MNSDKTKSNHDQRWLIYVVFFFGIVILGIIAYLLLNKFSSLGITPVDVGLLRGNADLARVMYETETLIVSLGALLATVIAFIVPFSFIMWSQMEDSHFSLFIEILRIKEKFLNIKSKKEFCEQIRDQIRRFRSAAGFAQYIARTALAVSTAGLIVLGFLSATGWPCWNIAHYVWIRGIFSVEIVVLAILILLLVIAFIWHRPEIRKGEKHLKIIERILESFSQDEAVQIKKYEELRKNEKK